LILPGGQNQLTGGLVSKPGRNEGDARLKASYGGNYARPAAVKSKQDSAN